MELDQGENGEAAGEASAFQANEQLAAMLKKADIKDKEDEETRHTDNGRSCTGEPIILPVLSRFRVWDF